MGKKWYRGGRFSKRGEGGGRPRPPEHPKSYTLFD
ncbi:uncharacterized protein G2W53_032382 [Senna tora]|uniref:Uncharacterized protein n=1 Tax=Senna tora TaxID=362788 RepID=A0A834SX92_9FABA|nr:uncharacterized protein G2W53_032382 [Senna tora]